MPYLRDRYNVQCDVSSLFDEGYLRKRFNLGKSGYFDFVKALAKRIRVVFTAKEHDLIFLYCEAVPYFPSIMEKMLKISGIPLAYDFDDAIFHNYDQHPNGLVRMLFRNKIKKVLALADIVVAGNAYLAEYARQVNPGVFIVPTVIDINRYPAKDYGQISEKPFTIGWIGSPTTSAYLTPLLPVLKRFCAANKARVVFIGSGKVSGINKDFEVYEWSEDSEIDNLLSFDVGIMPLPDTSWARGKCGFKLIQYMACGLPVIASPVGVNNEIVENNKNGFLAETDEQWYERLVVLYDDVSLRKRMGAAGRSKVINQYSLQATSHNLALLLDKAISQ
jgi:glycosyltransferase involved in cell wall biosynthesis